MRVRSCIGCCCIVLRVSVFLRSSTIAGTVDGSFRRSPLAEFGVGARYFADNALCIVWGARGAVARPWGRLRVPHLVASGSFRKSQQTVQVVEKALARNGRWFREGASADWLLRPQRLVSIEGAVESCRPRCRSSLEQNGGVNPRSVSTVRCGAVRCGGLCIATVRALRYP